MFKCMCSVVRTDPNFMFSAQQKKWVTCRDFTKTLNMKEKKFDLEDRLVDFTCRMIDVVDALPDTRAGNYIASQLIKSCHSPSLNYAEAQAAESINDFVHKLGIVLKELKECRTALKIIGKKELIKPVSRLDDIF